jgi:hypothetical protein
MSSRAFFITFISLDVLLLSIYLYYAGGKWFGYADAIPFYAQIGRDWAAPEILNYIKWVAAAVASAALYSRSRDAGHLSLAIIFLIALFDDAGQIHETLANHVTTTSFERGAEIAHGTAELFVFAGLGVICGTVMVIGFWRASPKTRQQMLIASAFMFLGVICAVFIDWWHSQYEDGNLLEALLGVVEDFGESLATTFAATYMVYLLLQPDAD